MMKKTLISALLAAPITVNAGSSIPEQYAYLGIHGSLNFFDIGDHINGGFLEDTLFPGVQYGYRFRNNLSAQLWWEQNDANIENGPGDVTLTNYYLSGRYHYRDNDWLGFEPYTGAAVGNQKVHVIDRNELMAGFEMGLQRGFAKRFIFDVGFRPLYGFTTERWDAQLYAGLNIAFAMSGYGNGYKTADAAPAAAAQSTATAALDPAAAAVTAAAIIDSDADGVPDSSDTCPTTPAGAKVDADGCQLVLEEAIRETLYVQFAVGTATVSEASMPEIERVATRLREFPSASLVLEGHTDNSGSAELNRRLSQQRAEAVRQVMIDRFAIDAERIRAVGRGEDAPAFANDTAANRAKNRRVEAILEAERTVPQTR